MRPVAKFEELANRSPVDRSWSRDTAVACVCCCDGADAFATELMMRAAASPLEVPPRPSSRCCQQHLEEGRDEDDQLSARLFL